MNRLRHGGRIGLILGVLVGPACRPEADTSVPRALPTVAIASRVPSAAGLDSAVKDLVWGEGPSAGQLAALSMEGRFLLERAGRSPGDSRSLSAVGEEPATAIAIVGPHRLVAGTASGLILWDTSKTTARVLSRWACGTVTSVVKAPGPTAEMAVLVGLRDGRVVRSRLVGEDAWEQAAQTAATGPEVTRLVLTPDRSELIVLRADGSSQRLRSDLVGAATDAGVCRRIAFGPGSRMFLRAVDEFTIETSHSPAQRVTIPARVTSLAVADLGQMAVVGMEGAIHLIPVPQKGAISPLLMLRVSLGEGLAQVSLDPGDPSGRRLAIAFGAGGVERIDLDKLIARGVPARLDDEPSLAFQPWLRFGRSRQAVSTEGGKVSEVDRRIGEARRQIEAGEVARPRESLTELVESGSASSESSAEALALIASALGRDGGASGPTLQAIARARRAFERLDQRDRVADCDFWAGILQTRGFGPDRAVASTEEGLAALQRALARYRSAESPQPRQASLAAAMVAWSLLDRGEVAKASAQFASVGEAVRSDPVLRLVPELDRIGAAIAMALKDYDAAERSYARLLQTERPAPQAAWDRAAKLGRAQALAALNRWEEAAKVLADIVPGDAEWTLRRHVCQLMSGQEPPPATPSAEDDPLSAHVRALEAIVKRGASAANLEKDLVLAVEGHRRAGHLDLSLEAELLLAEFLETNGHHVESAKRFHAVCTGLEALPERDGARSGERPILGLLERSARGWLREEMRGGKLDSSFLAHPRAALPDLGALGLNLEEFSEAEELSRSREKLRELGGPGLGAVTESLELQIRRIETQLAGRTARRDSGENGLGLSESEALVAFVATGPDTLAGIVVRQGSEPIAVPLPTRRAELESLIDGWRMGLGDGGRPLRRSAVDRSGEIVGLGPEPEGPGGSDPALVGSREGAIHQALFAPLQSHLGGVTRLLLVPGSAVGGLPIEMMGRGNRLLDQYAVTYLPEPGLLPALRDDRRAPLVRTAEVLFWSPNHVREAKFWAASCRDTKWKPVALLGASASRHRLLSLALGPYSVIHLAAPIEPVVQGGEFSLMLADGLFTPRDLAALPLRSQVLVLQFAGREGLTADGLRLWAEAALRTGVGGVVMSLWEPPAESARVYFAEFYRALKAGESLPRSVGLAREAVARRPEFRDPVHWAGFVVYGP